MARALALARRGVTGTDPNPRVGCVLVAGGEVVGEGWHRRAGEPHAEALALAAAGERARGATAYVSLEPCNHQGRTPPCTEALIRAGVRRVVYAHDDPNPAVAGRGAARLREAGIEVRGGVLAGPAGTLNAGFIQRMRSGRPRVTVKLAASLDGRTAMADGESQWITGPEARADVQWLRACSGAVLTGSGTLLVDDPRLDVRREDLAATCLQPLRAVVDSTLRTPPQARIIGADARAVVFTTHGADAGAQARLEAAGVRVERVAAAPGGCALPAVIRRLGELGANEVLVEAGPRLAGALAEAGLVDAWVIYLAPRLLGDLARGMVTLPGLGRLAEAPRLAWHDCRRVGEDLRLTLAHGPATT